MRIDKSLLSGSTMLLVLKLIGEKDMYGYEMIDTLRRRSDDTFALKAGTLYPILHNLEVGGAVTGYDAPEGGRVRRYYSITKDGLSLLHAKETEWQVFSGAVNRVLQGGTLCESV